MKASQAFLQNVLDCANASEAPQGKDPVAVLAAQPVQKYCTPFLIKMKLSRQGDRGGLGDCRIVSWIYDQEAVSGGALSVTGFPKNMGTRF